MVAQANIEMGNTGRATEDREGGRPGAANVAPASTRFAWATVIVSCWFVGITVVGDTWVL